MNDYQPKLVHISKISSYFEGVNIYISEKYKRGKWDLPQSKWYESNFSNNINKYRNYLLNNIELYNNIYELVGQELNCWCGGVKQKTCHGNVLVDETNNWLKEYYIRNRDSDGKNNNIRVEIIPQQRYNLLFSGQKYKDKPKKPQCIIKWDNKLKKWNHTNDVQLIETPESELLKLPCDAVLEYDDIVWERPKGSYVTKNGYVHFSIEKINSQKNEIKIQENEDYTKYIISNNNIPSITTSHLTKLYSISENIDCWTPFVCVVKGRLQHKKSGRYMLLLNDGNMDESHKVHVGTKLFSMIKDKFIDVNDVILVTQYAASRITTQRKIVIIYELFKYQKNGGSNKQGY